jgi:hypothetical protein
MSAPIIAQAKALLKDRRVQIGAGGALLAVALCSLVLAASGKPDPIRPELADHAGLAVLVQPAPEPGPPAPIGQLATLDPSQIDRVAVAPTPLDPDLAAAMRLERRQEAAALAEQRAFDARMKAEMDETLRPTPAEPPRQGGSTSNSEEPADEPAA